MAKKHYRPGRTLAIFLLLTGVLAGLAALGGTWSPKLGLDLRGGTRITLVADDQNPTETQLQEASAIIDNRVNGTGVAEAEVSTQGNRNVIVEIPGKASAEMINSLSRTADLRFRLVASCGTGPCIAPGRKSDQEAAAKAQASASAEAKASAEASKKAAAEKKAAKKKAAQKKAAQKKKRAAANRVAPGFDSRPSTGESPSPSPSSSTSPNVSDPSPSPSTKSDRAASGSVKEALAWQQQPDQESVAAFLKYTCPEKGKTAAVVADQPGKPLVACDDQGSKYLLSEALIEGTDLKSASFGPPPQGTGWAVQLGFKASARDTFGDVTTALQGNGQRFAIVLDSNVLSAPGVNEAILSGNAEITGDFTESEARNLANSLKYGSLPLRFPDPSVEEIGASLAGNQLHAGLIAGGIGLALVMGYCLMYYRGLGLVVISSLVLAGVVTYAAVLVLSKTAGFTLTLPGIAGLIVAVGITADSFIVYFERIRDEMRGGRSMRVAVETGWKSARNTCLAADTVSFLAAVVLYIFAIGVVKGFAFALGLSTLIDVAVFFWFTKPVMSLLAKREFFNTGHKYSGLSAETLGIDAPYAGGPLTQGGRA